MLRFDWKPIRERDADGRLTAAGVQWTEMRKATFATVITVANLALMASMAGCAHQQAFAGSRGGTLAVWLLGFCVVCVMTARLSPARTRALIFRADGRTSAPFGFTYYARRYREMSASNANLVSIEARSDGGSDAYVAVYSRSGDVTYVAGHLLPDNAHKVAVQLTLALAELRESMASPREVASGARAKQLID